jgi:hypothetical protein
MNDFALEKGEHYFGIRDFVHGYHEYILVHHDQVRALAWR